MAAEKHPDQYEQRKAQTKRLLHEALARLLAGTPQNQALQTRRWKLDVKTLSEEAGISRNTIYQNHTDVLDKLRKTRESARAETGADSAKNKSREHKRARRQWEQDRSILITENAKLLARALDAERELEEFRTHHDQLGRRR